MLETLLNSGTPSSGGVIFLGEVTTANLISGTELATAIGLSAGTAQHSNEPWLQWEIDGKIVYYAKKPYRHTISWDSISEANAVDGSRTLVIAGETYSVSLPMGVNPDNAGFTGDQYGYDIPYSHNSEWNRLMYPITVATSQNPKLSQVGPNQANYTEADLVVHSSGGNGIYSWCREVASLGPTYRVGRGNDGVSYLHRSISSYAATSRAWRPRLELIL